jgi:hypothetical protein
MADDTNSFLGIGPAQPPSSSPQHDDIRWRRANKLTNRYRDSYRVASLLVRLGGIIKVIGFVLGGIALLVGLIGGIATGSDREAAAGLGIFLLAILYGAIIVFALYVYGVVIAGIGQLLQAVCDAAVYNTPFLDDENRAAMLSLDE